MDLFKFNQKCNTSKDCDTNFYKENKNTIGIVGYGYVGQAVHKLLSLRNFQVFIYDKFKNKDNLNDILRAYFVFVCVPTPFEKDNKCYNAFEETLDFLCKNKFKGIVIIKSTVLEDRIRPYLTKLRIVFWPEFLNQNSAFEDIWLEKTLLGGDFDNAMEVVKELKLFDYKICTIKEASDFKYIRNVYGAYKVLFWNFVQETTGNARKMHDLLKFIPQGDMEVVGMDGKLGYGGACFPKDVKTFDEKHSHELTKFMIDYNEKLLKVF